ncbi:MAG: thiazole synthase [Candidatus Berkiellales bacterium]
MWQLADKACASRILLGTAQYPSLEILQQAIRAAKTSVITVSLKRENPYKKAGSAFWEMCQETDCYILPNTAGCKTAREAIQIAQMARDIFNTSWIKLEVVFDEELLVPHSFELVKAAEKLIGMGFEVFPFCTDDLLLCKNLVEVGCRILMPWGAPIGSGKGLLDPYQLKILRLRFPEITLIVDAGLGSPLHAMQAMLLGYDAILINSAVAKALSPIKMAKAFHLAVRSGRLAYQAGVIPESDFAVASTPLTQTFYGSI